MMNPKKAIGMVAIVATILTLAYSLVAMSGPLNLPICIVGTITLGAGAYVVATCEDDEDKEATKD